MASTFDNNLRLREMGTGDESGTWGNRTNENLELIGEALGYGTEAITTNADLHTTTVSNGATAPGRAMYLKYTGTLDSACTITLAPNTISKLWFIENATGGAQNIIISQGSGANVTIPNGKTKLVFTDGAGSGAAVTDGLDKIDLGSNSTLNGGGFSDVTASSTTTFTNKTFDANGTGNSISNIENADISASAAIAFSKMENLTASKALQSDGNGDVSASGVTNTELGYVSGVTSAIQTQLNTLTTAVNTKTTIEAIYPVGSIYINATNSTNPATLLGFGTWTAFGAGRVPVGIDSSDTAFDTAEETGGAKTHTLTESELPSHSHNIATEYYPQVEYYGGAEVNILAFRNNTSPDGADATTASATTGSGTAHNILQPYIVVYMWKRTA